MKDIDLINKYTQTQLSTDDVFVFSLVLCDNEIDRDFEAFDKETLVELAKHFVGKPGVFDHSGLASDQNARIFFTEVREKPEQKNLVGETYCQLFAKAYMVRTDDNASLIKEIEGGIKKEVSVGAAIKSGVCSICGNPMESARCNHQKGKTYGKKPCFKKLCGAADAYEWSFVAVPAQRNAGVSKAFGFDRFKKYCDEEKDYVFVEKSELNELVKSLESLEESAAYGEIYRRNLLAEIKKHFAVNFPGCNSETMMKFASTLNPGELFKFSKEIKSLKTELPKLQTN